MFCTVSGCLFIQSFPLVFFRYPMAYSLAPPAIRPLRALPPLLAPVMAPSMPWRAAFSAEPSFHPLWEAIAWMARFPTIPSSSNSRFLSSTFVLSKISLSLFRLSSVFLFSFSISCFWFSLSVMVMVPWGTAEIVVESALSFYRKSFINHQSSEPYTSKPTNNNIAPTKSQPIKRILSCGLYFRATFFL